MYLLPLIGLVPAKFVPTTSGGNSGGGMSSWWWCVGCNGGGAWVSNITLYSRFARSYPTNEGAKRWWLPTVRRWLDVAGRQCDPVILSILIPSSRLISLCLCFRPVSAVAERRWWLAMPAVAALPPLSLPFPFSGYGSQGRRGLGPKPPRRGFFFLRGGLRLAFGFAIYFFV